MEQIGFDSDKYLRMQPEKIKERIDLFGGKLYLEFGGKLFDDYHAARVLPGFKPDSKVKMLMELSRDTEIVIVISADDIERNKLRGDFGITYDQDVLRLIDAFRECGLYVGSVVMTHYREQAAAELFEKRLQALGVSVYRHYVIPDYPANVPLIVSDEGFGKNDYIETTHSLVVVTAPGPGSGKMATCLSQLYHDHRRGIRSGYAKFETFPIWNLPLKHPLHLAYEAATADLSDVNMIDNYHLDAYGETTVNYNRDIEIFPVLRTILERISDGEPPYRSPTDMGVNMVGYCITDDELCSRASEQEIVRRYFDAMCGYRMGTSEQSEVLKIELLMNQIGIADTDRPVVAPARERAKLTGEPAFAIELTDGTIVTGKTSALLGPASACLLNALKTLAGLDDAILVIAPEVIEPIQRLKVDHMESRNPRLHTDEVLIALAISAVNDENAAAAMAMLSKLEGCEAHSTVILSRVDETVFRNLGVNVTCDPEYQRQRLYHGN